MPQETKQVIVMRRNYPDGKGGVMSLRKGKAAAQAAHVSMAFITRQLQRRVLMAQQSHPKTISVLEDPAPVNFVVALTTPQRDWIAGSFVKVVCKANSEEELVALEEKAIAAGVVVHRCVDAGRTEFHGEPTLTCIAIGPDYEENIDPLTKDLPLW